MNENMQPNSAPIVNPPVNSMPENNMQPNSMNMPENKSSIGSIIGTIIVIAIIILGGLYFWGKRIDEGKAKADLVSDANNESVVVEENMEANAIKSVSGSDDLNSIESDLGGTKLDNLGNELNVVAQ